MKKTLLICPLPLELNIILKYLKNLYPEFQIEQVGDLKVYNFSELKLKLALGGHGKTQFGIQTQFLLSHFAKIERVICAGCAGSLDEKVLVGDVVAAVKTIEHDFRLKYFKGPLPEFFGNPELLKELSQIKFDHFNIHFGPIASGDEDLNDPDRANSVKTETHALAVAWEGAGGARAAKWNRIPFLEIRGITDNAFASDPKNFKSNLEIAIENVCKTLLGIIIK